MKDRFHLKIAFIFVLLCFLMIPQLFLNGLIDDRERWRSQAVHSIRQSWPGTQTLGGPIIAVPYKLVGFVTEKVNDGTERTVTRQKVSREVAYLLPTQLTIRGSLQSSLRARGIHEVPVYSCTLRISGEFSPQPLTDLAAAHRDKQVFWGTPTFSVLLADQRGITDPASLQWASTQVPFLPGARLPEAREGMHAKLPELNPTRNAPISFSFDVHLRGMQALHFAQMAENTDFELTADWPHPSFSGEMLPETRDVTDSGFTAHWKSSAFSSNIGQTLELLQGGNHDALLCHGVGVNLVQPGDVYQQANRCIKYAILFLILTFGAMLLFELVHKTPIHPVQYTFVGFALMIFYLLLISLSERLAFPLSYALAAMACTALLGCYFGAILRSRPLGLSLGGGLLVLYLVLYIILQAEENALIMGSLLLFAVLSGLMLTTRHFDWYALTGSRKTASLAPEPKG